MANEAAWAARLARYKGPELKRSVWQLASAAALFGGAWALMYASLRVCYWLTLLLAVPAAFFLIRLFIIQHDCGHAAFFRAGRPEERGVAGVALAGEQAAVEKGGRHGQVEGGPGADPETRRQPR